MSRSGSFFVALCMVAIAASAAVVCATWLAMDLGASAAVGLALVLAMALGHLGAERARDREAIEAKLTDLTRAQGLLAHRQEEFARRVERAEGAAIDKARAATKEIVEELDELGGLVHQFAQTLQAHEAILTRPAPAPTTAPPAAPPPVEAPVARETAPPRPAAPTLAAPRYAGALAGMTEAEAVAAVGSAIGAKRYDLFLQPIVTLPQRRVRWYHATLRLRGPDGEQIAPADYRDPAEAGGLSAAIDEALFDRALIVARRLISTNRDSGVVIDLSGSAFADAPFVSRFIGLLSTNKALADSLLFSVRLDDYRAFSALEIETIRAAAELGFRFALSDIGDFLVEPRDIADKGFRQVRLPAALLVDRASAERSAIHPADLSGLFARHGVDMVVDGVEQEQLVPELLDHDVRFAQGPLFSPPRPVRADVLAAGAVEAPPATPVQARAEREPAVVAPKPAPPPQPTTLGAAALAAGALGGRGTKTASPSLGQGLRSLIGKR